MVQTKIFFFKQFPCIAARSSWVAVCIADRRKTHIHDVTPQANPTVRGFPPWWQTPMKYWEIPADKLYMTKKYISCEPYTTFSLSYEQIHGDSPNNRQSGTFEFSNSTQTVFRWMKISHNHSLNPVKSNGSPPHHRTSPQRPRLSISFFGFTAIWEGLGRIRAALGWEISRWHRLHPLWSRQNIRSSCLRREKAEGWKERWQVGSSLPQEETARFTPQLEAEELPLPVNYDLLTT